MTITGIDNGISGAIVKINDGNVVFACLMPTFKIKKKVYLDLEKINQILENENVIIEKPSKHSLGMLALCSTWESYGLIKGLAFVVAAKFESVDPRKWQSSFWKKRKGDTEYNTKKESIKAAQSIWPDQTFIPSKRHRVPHSGLTDAALIAKYGEISGIFNKH